MIVITSTLSLNETDFTISFTTSRGPGGQNVNKVATAALLRFNVLQSPSLSAAIRARLVAVLNKRLTSEGDLIIKAGRFRTQERNRQDAIDRLCEILRKAEFPPKKRHKTRPTLASKKRRLTDKKAQGKKKSLRRDNVGDS